MATQACSWVVLVLCCVMSFQALGLSFGMGAIFTDIMDTFHVTRTSAALVQSLCGGFGFGAGVVTGPFLRGQGARVTVVSGNVVAATGCVLAYLAPNIALVILGLGAMAGVGVSCNFLTAQVLAGTLLAHIRSLALSAVAISGATGTALFPLVLRRLTAAYTLQGAFLILAAMHVQLVLCGVVLGFCISWRGRNIVGEEEAEETISTAGEKRREARELLGGVDQEESMLEGDKEIGRLRNEEEEASEVNAKDGDIKVNVKDADVVFKMKVKSADARMDVKDADFSMNTTDGEINGVGNVETTSKVKAIDSNGEADWEISGKQDADMEEGERHTERGEALPLVPTRQQSMDRNDRQQNASRPEYEITKTIVKDTSLYKSRQRKTTLGRLGFGCLCGTSCQALGVFRTGSIFQLEIVRDVRFLAFTVVGMTFMLSLILPSMFLMDMVVAKNFTLQDGTVFLTTIFIGNISARAVGGIVYHFLKGRIVYVFALSMVTGGASCFCYLFADDYADFVAVSAIYGLCFGFYASTTPMSFLEILGPGRFAVGMGYASFMGGVAILLAGPLGGLVRDLGSSYQPLFYSCLGHGALAGAFLTVVALRLRHDRRR